MSHYSENITNELSMCPCRSAEDIPQGKPDAIESSEEGEPVDTGFEVLSGDSGSDDEQDPLEAQGYIPLSQNEYETVTASGTEVAEEEVSAISETDEKPVQLGKEPGAQVEKPNDETSSSSSSAFSSSRGSQMDEDEIDLIKSVMANIKIPSSSIPDWAKRIPEEKWKAPLVLSLQQKSSSKGKLDRKPS